MHFGSMFFAIAAWDCSPEIRVAMKTPTEPESISQDLKTAASTGNMILKAYRQFSNRLFA